MKFVQLDMFHSYIETEGIIIEFVFFLQKFWIICEIGTF